MEVFGHRTRTGGPVRDKDSGEGGRLGTSEADCEGIGRQACENAQRSFFKDQRQDEHAIQDRESNYISRARQRKG